jgi:hypothetical protein
MAEYQAGLQAISSAVFALDALYSVISGMITISEAEKEKRRVRNHGRAVWVSDAMLRASAGMTNDVRKTMKNRIHRAYKARDLAVHPPYTKEPFAIHPHLHNAKVPKRWIDYNLEASIEIVGWIVEVMLWVIDHPQSRNHALISWAAIASGILHRIIGPIANSDPGPSLAS